MGAPEPPQQAVDRKRPGGDQKTAAGDLGPAGGDRKPARGDRDRDPAGRARNSRPRDALGRPLPYGSPDVARAPEGVVRTPDETIAEAQRLLDAGLPFHAHEVFEDAWKSGAQADRGLWKGLAQIAVGLTHLARGNNNRGAQTLLRRGAAAIDPYRQAGPYGLDIAGVAQWARELAAGIRQSDAEPGDSAPTPLAATGGPADWSAPRLRSDPPG